MSIESADFQRFLNIICPEELLCAPSLLNLLITIAHVSGGSTQKIEDFNLEIAEGRVKLCKAKLPLVGELTEGELAIFGGGEQLLGPVTFILRGVDINFLVQNSTMLNFSLLSDSGRPIFRTVCIPANPNASLSMVLPELGDNNQIVIHRKFKDTGDKHTLNIQVLKGTIRFLTEGVNRFSADQEVINNRIEIIREKDSDEIILSFLKAGFLFYLMDGQLRRIRIFGEDGLITRIALLGLQSFSSFVSVAPLSTFP